MKKFIIFVCVVLVFAFMLVVVPGPWVRNEESMDDHCYHNMFTGAHRHLFTFSDRFNWRDGGETGESP